MKNSFISCLPEYRDISPGGELKSRLEKSINHLDSMPRERLIEDLIYPDRAWSYGADFVGRWLHVLSIASRFVEYSKTDFGIETVVHNLQKFQESDGMLGKVHNNTTFACLGRGLRGLIEAYETFGYSEALTAAEKIIGFYEKSFPGRPAHRACMGLADIVRYGEITGEKKAFLLARRIYDSSPELGPQCPFGNVSGNLHMFIFIHRGLVSLYMNTGEKDLLDQAEALQEWLKNHKAWISGGICEWLDPQQVSNTAISGNEDKLFFKNVTPLAALRDETCTTADWMMLNLELGLATGNDTYTSVGEHIFWNHFLSGQADNGGWCGRRDLTGMAGEVWDFCCSHHGTFALMDAMRYVLIRWGDGIRLNLHLPVSVNYSWSGISINSNVNFNPSTCEYSIAFRKGTYGRFPVNLRRPKWGRDLSIVSDGKNITDAANGDVRISGLWRAGDRIICRYTPRVVLHNDSTPPISRIAAQVGTLMLSAGNFESKNTSTINLSCEKTISTRRIRVNLGGKFIAVIGEFWVAVEFTDRQHPEYGIMISLISDDEIMPGCQCSPRQGDSNASHVFAAELNGKETLTIELTSNNKGFPIEAGRVTSLRLFADDGSVAFLDEYLDGGKAPLHRPKITQEHLSELLSKSGDSWPLKICTEDCSFTLTPMKDVENRLKEGGEIGRFTPIEPRKEIVLNKLN